MSPSRLSLSLSLYPPKYSAVVLVQHNQAGLQPVVAQDVILPSLALCHTTHVPTTFLCSLCCTPEWTENMPHVGQKEKKPEKKERKKGTKDSGLLVVVCTWQMRHQEMTMAAPVHLLQGELQDAPLIAISSPAGRRPARRERWLRSAVAAVTAMGKGEAR